MARSVTANDVKAWLSDGDELAFLDVREHGQYGEAHPFFVVPAPYSTFEARLPVLAPRRDVRLVLVDDGDGVAARAAAGAEALGYSAVHVLDGGAPAWAAAGHTLYAGVNVPSKTFGELLELARHTPRLTAEQVATMQRSGADHVIVDGRPYAEYTKMSIPGGICCPNGELALRIRDLVPDPATTIVVNCAGRTRSILGAQTLIDAGIPNPVYALENGTQGWFLAGLELARGATEKYPETSAKAELDEHRRHARTRAERAGAGFISAGQAAAMLADTARTIYLVDVRTDEEFARDGIAGSRHAPGGQLVQATDQWVGVRGAAIILLDDDGVRAPMVANWLAQLGHRAFVLEGGVAAASADGLAERGAAPATTAPPRAVAAADLAAADVQLVDLRSSMDYHLGHISGARWSIRPRLDRLGLDPAGPVVLIGAADVVALAARDLAEAGCNDLAALQGGPDDWRAAGLTIAATPDDPVDADRIDFLFFTAERHNSNEAASRQYLEWEIGLVDQLDDQERAAFRILEA